MNIYNPNYSHKKSLAVVGQKAIIINENNEILVLQRSEKSGNGGKWSLVGGALETGEDPVDGIKREIYEEARLEVSEIKPVHLFSYANNDKDFVVMIGYVCKAKSEKVVINWEHDDYKWLPVEEALKLDLSEHGRIFIEQFRKGKN